LSGRAKVLAVLLVLVGLASVLWITRQSTLEGWKWWKGDRGLESYGLPKAPNFALSRTPEPPSPLPGENAHVNKAFAIVDTRITYDDLHRVIDVSCFGTNASRDPLDAAIKAAASVDGQEIKVDNHQSPERQSVMPGTHPEFFLNLNDLPVGAYEGITQGTKT